MIAHALHLTRPGRPHCRGAAATGVLPAAATLPAAFFALVATALAAAGHHLVFAGTASAVDCLVAAMVLFVGGLLRAPGRGSLPADCATLTLAQVSACGLFVCLSPGATPVGAALHGALSFVVHLVMTLITACALRAAASSRSPLSAVLQEQLRALAHRLRVLTVACTTTVPTVDPGRPTGVWSGCNEEPRSEVLVTGTTGRRGPP
ncbi:hypothetical protein [Streptomyces sp. NPDC006527]|uniref:hypothetical protein n=1 Tax=Streptomyces sp. NPDC006527 TaxID=3364749 RepID=UPI0036BAFB6E